MTVLSSGLSRRELAARIALDIPEGSVVNLGIGAPTLVADAIPEDVEVVLHTENGMPAMGPAPVPGHIDPDLINAGKQPVTERPGASYFHHADSFAMMRGGHLDICVLGAFQISEHGDLANWHTGAVDAIPAVGGAMDLAVGAKSVWVMTDLLTRTAHQKSSHSAPTPSPAWAASPASTPTTRYSTSPPPALRCASCSAPPRSTRSPRPPDCPSGMDELSPLPAVPDKTPAQFRHSTTMNENGRGHDR
ncbi:hypothetical protein SGFS_099080 [Streptomyces graminofaciens]|uniref:3-oxoadipate CoA-transferase n=1 Tax=Streptomyces graminofaciens TaxID=68212 RepID=A0ABM7FKG8_9ACTN|nr:hypothetical protein SGFS_099080 [Streptomyces graminofaciens]